MPGQFQLSPVAVTIDELLSLRQLAHTQQRNKIRVKTEKSGETQSRVLGRGLDFSELREYQAGDDIRQIDWNVTARTGTPHTKLFNLEREKPCFIVVDLRRPMFFATRGAFKSVVAARLAAVIAWSALQNNDRVGGLVFTENTHLEIKPESGRRGLMRLFRTMVEAIATYDKKGEEVSRSFADAITRLTRIAHTGSNVWYLGDFYGFDTKVKAAFSGLMQHNGVCAIQIADALESKLPPPGRYRLKSGSRFLRISTTSRDSRRDYSDRFVAFQEELRHFFSRGQHRFLTLYTGQTLEAQCGIALGTMTSRAEGILDES